MSKRIGILHPGQMGASVGAAARTSGSNVAWASDGRSETTRRRALEAGLEDATTLRALAEGSEVLLSVCPPSSAVALAEVVATVGFGGVYVDANAIAPATARVVADIVARGGARFVDGGIVGPPAVRPGTTRLYLSGPDAEGVAELFEKSALEAIVVDGPPGAASALKMCYAAWTKGSDALLVAIRALAAAEGVADALTAEWGRSQPGLAERSGAAVRKNASKAWRFVGEMHEIAASFEAAGLPAGFHRAAADVYARLEAYKDCPTSPEPEAAFATVLDAGEARSSTDGARPEDRRA